MFLNGITKETINLKNKLPKTHFLLSIMGYKETFMYINGATSKKNAIKNTITKHKKYSKKQITWFKKEKWWKKIWPFVLNK